MSETKEKKDVGAIVTGVFKVSFPAVFDPKYNDLNGKEEYSIEMLFKKDDPELAKLKTAVGVVARKKWPEKLPANFRSPFKDGDEKTNLQGYEGCTYIRAKSNEPVGIVDQKLQKIISKADFYAGCFARASIVPYAYDQKGNRGVAFGLRNIQKVKDGEKISGRANPEDEFGVLEGGADSSSDEGGGYEF